MVYYRRLDDTGISTLIDFDFVTYPKKAALPFVESPVPDPPFGRVFASINDIVKEKSDGHKGVKLKIGQYRLRTAPFMAIEALDLTTANYKHHLCHELESIFYVSVWYGVVSGHRRGIFPRSRDALGEESKHPDYLRSWRVGSWQDIMNAKDNFLSNPISIERLVKHGELGPNCELLALFFRRRRDAAQQVVDRAVLENALRRRTLFKQGIATWDIRIKKPALKYDIAIYPSYARALGMDLVECKEDCCIRELSSWM